MSTEEIKDLCQELKRKEILNLNWSADPASFENPWIEGWADVYIEEICQPLDLNWLVTVVDLKDSARNQRDHLAIEKDAALIFRFENDSVAATKKFFFKPGHKAVEISLEKDKDENEFYWSLYKRPEYLYQESIYIVPVWSVDRIETVVTKWLKSITGVEFNLSFNPDKPSPIRAEVEAEVENIKKGGKTFDLGDGVRASETAFDEFLNDPDMAKAVLSQIKKNL
jgi:hypothetical protein